MTFYIGKENTSGIHCESFEEFCDYLKEELQRSEKEGNTEFSVTIEN